MVNRKLPNLSIIKYIDIRDYLETMMTKTRKDYNYRQISILFDLDVEEDRELMKWLEDHKAKRNSFCVLIKRALKSYIKGVEQVQNK